MPNHITNKLHITGNNDRVKEIVSLITDDEGLLDFDKIIPCPQIIKDAGEPHLGIVTAVKDKYHADVSSNPLIAVLELSNRAKNKLNPKDHDCFEKCCAAYEATGYAYWYDWNIENWGTKWNAYSQPDERTNKDKGEIYFQTAWSAPVPIMVKLTEMFPDVSFSLWYADEDTGSNTGLITCKGGMYRVERLPNGSNSAYEMAFELNPSRKDNYMFVDGKYKYVGED